MITTPVMFTVCLAKVLGEPCGRLGEGGRATEHFYPGSERKAATIIQLQCKVTLWDRNML